MSAPTLLPDASTTDREAAAEQAMLVLPEVAAGVAAIRNVKGVRPAAFHEALLWEYGLSELRLWIADTTLLFGEGRQWLIERDTDAAIHRVLGWLGYSVTLVQAHWRWRWWNSFQVYLDSVPLADHPDLDAIEGLTNVSKAFRSDFRRAVSGYDVPALIFDDERFDEAQFDDDSGVWLKAGGVKWSFGRPYDIEHMLAAAEAGSLGLVYPLAAPGTPATWADYDLPWSAAQLPWNADRPTVQLTVNGYRLAQKIYHVALYDAGDQVIGYRRARVARQVSRGATGQYGFGGDRLAISAQGGFLLVEALTGFGDGAGQTVASAAVIVDANAGKQLWLVAGELSGGIEIARRPLSIELRETVRERISFLLNIGGA